MVCGDFHDFYGMEAELCDTRDGFLVGGRLVTVLKDSAGLIIEDEDIEVSGGSFACVESSERSGGGVTGISEQFFSVFGFYSVQLLECGVGHIDLASDGKVEGFSFRVTGVDYDQTFKTDKNGEIVIEGLRIGDYTVSEVSDKASAGYILPADKQATVKVDATAIVQMHNEFRDTPKTGDDFNLGLWVSLAALSVVGAGVLGFVGYKNRKKKKED